MRFFQLASTITFTSFVSCAVIYTFMAAMESNLKPHKNKTTVQWVSSESEGGLFLLGISITMCIVLALITQLHDNEAVDRRIKAAAGEIETKRSFFAEWCIMNSPRSSFNLNLTVVFGMILWLYLRETVATAELFFILFMLLWNVTRL